MKQTPLTFEKNSIQWVKLLIGLIAVFALFHWLATILGSDRGQFGVIVGLIVVGAIIFVEIFLFGNSFIESVRKIGLMPPKMISILIVFVISFLMLLMVIVFAFATNSSFSFYSNWYLLIPGLFFQAGIAEETLFRGYLFGHIRQKYGFWKAAFLSAIPFILIHLFLFYLFDFAIALASIILSIISSFPFARLFELGGKTIWTPAILHFIIQGTVKVLVASGEKAELFPLVWIVICAIIPLLVFAFPQQSSETDKCKQN